MEAGKSVFEELVKSANEIFGVKGWSHEVIHQEIDFIENDGNSYRAGCSTIVRVVLDSGRFHQECGYSDTIAQTRGLALYKARSSSSTNALKKTFLSFGEMVPLIVRNNQKSQPTDHKYLIMARKWKAQQMQSYWNEIREKKKKESLAVQANSISTSAGVSSADVDNPPVIEINTEL